jgi:structural maintenance of chromosome 1
MQPWRLDDVEAKLVDTDKETENARKEVKAARDGFNAIKKKRFVAMSPSAQ